MSRLLPLLSDAAELCALAAFVAIIGCLARGYGA